MEDAAPGGSSSPLSAGTSAHKKHKRAKSSVEGFSGPPKSERPKKDEKI